jgi:hypothetical protein
VTGEKIDDPYFARLYALRNDAAKQEKADGVNIVNDGSTSPKPKQSNGGCESVHNERTSAMMKSDSCEAMTNFM